MCAREEFPREKKFEVCQAWFILGVSGLVHTGCVRPGSPWVCQAWFTLGVSGLVHTGYVRPGSHWVCQSWFTLDAPSPVTSVTHWMLCVASLQCTSQWALQTHVCGTSPEQRRNL